MMTGGVSAWPFCHWAARLPSSWVVTARSLPPVLSRTLPSFNTTTWPNSLGGLAPLPTLGTSTTPGVSMGAVTMKMMSNTSITSMKGTMLISFIERRRLPLREAMVGMRGSLRGSVARGAVGRVRAQVALQDVGELLDEGLLVDGHAVDVARKAVVLHHGRYGGKQADGGGHQRLGNTGGHVGQGDLLHAGKAGEGMHDAPHRAEQAHVGADRCDRAQEGQVRLHDIHLALKAGAHGAACAVEQGAGVADAALAQLLVFAHAAGKNALHGAGVLGVLHGAGVQVVEAGAGPELTLELVVQRAHPLEAKQLAENGRPAGDRYAQQQQHHELNHPAGVQHQVQDGHVLGIHAIRSRMVAGMRDGRMVAASTQPMRTVTSFSRIGSLGFICSRFNSACCPIVKEARPFSCKLAVTKS